MTRIALLAPFALLLLLPACVFAAPDDGRLDVYWVDVEGGAATLIVTPAGESILIDTGNPGGRDPGRIAHVAKEHAKIKQIDHLVITHYHRDHYGGAAELAQLIPIINLYENGNHDRRQEAGAEHFDKYLAMKVGKRHTIKAGDEIKLRAAPDDSPAQDTKLSITCLCAMQKTIPATDAHPETKLDGQPVRRNPDTSDNANSIVLLLRFGRFDFFDGGDLTWNTEEKLVYPRNLVGVVDVMQVNHHGLDSSSNPLLVNTIRPHVAVFNNGDQKGCQPLAFAAVRDCPSIKAIYQVHKNLRKDVQHNTKEAFIANLLNARDCKGHHIRMSVDPTGKTYTFAVPSRGHEAMYESK